MESSTKPCKWKMLMFEGGLRARSNFCSSARPGVCLLPHAVDRIGHAVSNGTTHFAPCFLRHLPSVLCHISWGLRINQPSDRIGIASNYTYNYTYIDCMPKETKTVSFLLFPALDVCSDEFYDIGMLLFPISLNGDGFAEGHVDRLPSVDGA